MKPARQVPEQAGHVGGQTASGKVHSMMDQLPESDPEKLALLYVQQWLQDQGYGAGGPSTGHPREI